jgi:hypothetical protein
MMANFIILVFLFDSRFDSLVRIVGVQRGVSKRVDNGRKPPAMKWS